MFQDKARSGGSPDLIALVDDDQDIVGETMAAVTDLTFNVKSGRVYAIRLLLLGDFGGNLRFDFGGGTATAALFRVGEPGGTTVSSTATTTLAGDILPDTGVGEVVLIEGALIPDSDGTLALRAREHIANSGYTIKEGSYMMAWRLA